MKRNTWVGPASALLAISAKAAGIPGAEPKGVREHKSASGPARDGSAYSRFAFIAYNGLFS